MKKDRAKKNPKKVSGQALKICGMTLICLGVMFAVAWMNRIRQENRLAEEYTISTGNPRHIRFENMPQGEAEMTAGLFFRYHAMAQYDRCSRLLAEDQAEFMNFEQQQKDFENGSYIEDYLVHRFETLAEEEYAGSKEYYDARADILGYEEYQVIRVVFHQTWSDQATQNRQRKKEGEYIREMAVGKGTDGWKIFEAGTSQEV